LMFCETANFDGELISGMSCTYQKNSTIVSGWAVPVVANAENPALTLA
jgi:hypothetical protein